VKGRQLYFIKSKTTIKSCHFDCNLRFFQYKSTDERFKSCSIRFKYSLEDLKEAEVKVKKEVKSKKKKHWSWIILGLNVLIVAGIFLYQFLTGDPIKIEDLFNSNANWNYLLLAILMVVIATVVESTKTFHLIYVSTHRIRPFLSYKSTALCRYYDAISPMSSAGEPFQIFYLKNRGIRGEIATSIPIVKSLFWQISFTLFSLILLLANGQYYLGSNPLIITIAWIGIAGNAIILSTIFFLSVSKKVAPRIVIWGLKLLYKMHIIKNYQLTFIRVLRFVHNYQNCMRTYASNFITITVQIILAGAELFVSALVPYFIYKTFVPIAEFTLIDIVTRVFICNLVSLLIPIPGGTGVAEFSFMAMFSSLFTNGTLVWAMLIWRILSYYQVILQGIGVTIYDTVIGNKKSEKLMQSGYFNDKMHDTILRRRKKKSQKVNTQIEH
ncbi:MAG: flippase-like domain-containing protein, partial [Clostridiales bacterium]|nr:flippase-like domain-containing protein [Candidatus Apopatousia equi]